MWQRATCLGVLVVLLAVFMGGLTTGGEKDKKDDPMYNIPTWVPTPDEVIAKMFEMAKVKKSDLIFDLGCGDNRICYMAAKKFGCRGVGIETNPKMIRLAMDMFDKYNENDAISYSPVKLPLVETRHGDALEAKDIGDANVVVMYMFKEFMTLWYPIAKEKLKPGTRIVSHDYQWEYDKIPDAWKPAATATVKSTMRDSHEVILWVVPEKKKPANRE
jgi:SAM-dependent methyltransferase